MTNWMMITGLLSFAAGLLVGWLLHVLAEKLRQERERAREARMMKAFAEKVDRWIAEDANDA